MNAIFSRFFNNVNLYNIFKILKCNQNYILYAHSRNCQRNCSRKSQMKYYLLFHIFDLFFHE